jgi:hypothetical protein
MMRSFVNVIWYTSSIVALCSAPIILALIAIGLFYPAQWIGITIQVAFTSLIVSVLTMKACSKFMNSHSDQAP